MNPDDRVVAIAASIADGSAIDWTAADSPATSADDRAVLEELKAIARLATVHRAPVTGPISADERGTRWGPLTLLAPIGQGRFGTVHLAWDARLERRVALKRLHLASSTIAADPSRAIDEARLLARVRHPNVLSVYGAECMDDEVGIWTEYIEGRTLDDMLVERGPMALADVVSIGVDLARALSAVHAAGLLHRDVKAQNVMRETGGRIVLMDFGTGHDLAAVAPKEGDLSGTPLYLAPEMFSGAPATVQSDVYALGVLLFRLLTGRFPVEGDTLHDVRTGHARNRVGRLRDLRLDLPARLCTVIDRSLSPTPRARYADARAFEMALEALQQPARPQRLSRVALLVVAVAAFAIFIAVMTTAWSVGRTAGPVAAGQTAADVTSLTVRKLANVPAHYLMGRPSHGGRFVPYVSGDGHLSIWEVLSRNSRRLVGRTVPTELGEWSVMSPDDKSVAYSWFTASGRYELRVVGVDDMSVRQLAVADDVDYPIPVEWSRDGRWILSSLQKRNGSTDLALVPVGGEALKVLQTIRTGTPRNASLSPDGRFVVFDLPDGTKDGRRDLFIAATDGATLRPLIKDQANNMMPFWTSDGRHVFFASDRSGSMDGWVVRVTNGTADGEPQLVARNLGRVSSLGLTGDGRYFYRLQTNAQDVYTVPIDLTGAAPPGTPRRISPAVVGGHIGPGWSPDGRFISYVSARGNTALDRNSNILTIQDTRTGQARDLSVSLSRLGVAAPKWSPDGRSLLVRGSDLENQPGLFRVDARSGDVRPVVLWSESETSDYGNFVWAPDGRRVFYLHQPRGIVGRDLSTGREAVLVAHRAGSSISSFAVSRHDSRLAAVVTTQIDGSRTSTIEVRTAGQPPREIFRVSGQERLVVQSFTPDTSALLVTRFTVGSAAPHQLMRIAIADGQAQDLLTIAGNTQANRVVLSPNARQLAYTAGVVSWETWVMEEFLPSP